jgi:N6-L-threonylcarbamoyladenine synthase
MSNEALAFPFVSLVVSGGHTSLYLSQSPTRHALLGGTIDDAAGEAFDKVASILGLGYPGGPAIEEAARSGDPSRAPLPRPHLPDAPFDFSFSGLKTAALYRVRPPTRGGTPGAAARAGGVDPRLVADLAASFQSAAVDVLVEKSIAAARRSEVRSIAVGGGVACNGRLREKVKARAKGLRVVFPAPALCTDNAAMIAGLGYHKLMMGVDVGYECDALPR